jgi:diguanylate cyclase (GGDEF)-like protein
VKLGEEAAARGSKRWLAALHSLSGQHPDRPARMTRGEPAILRLIAPLALLVIAATVVCSALGFVLAQQADDYLEAEHRQALRGAIEALQAVSPDLASIEPSLIRILENASGFKGLKFGPEPPEGGQEFQSLADSKGRIVGWFSWVSERPATAMMTRLLPFAAAIAFGLFGFAGLAMWQMRRLGFLLAVRERRVHQLECEDPLTGLPNDRQMAELLDRAVAERKGDASLGYLLIDLDGFSDLKQAVGEAAGDEAFKEIIERLRKAVPPTVLLARLTARKLALLMPSTDPHEALATAEAACEAVTRAVWVNQVVQLSASVGYALAPRDGVTGEELSRRALLALRSAQRRGRGLVIRFAAEMETDFEERRFIRHELSRALAARSFELHYQPIVKADGGAIVGVEALLRWNHATRGYIPPALFVKVAEEAGLMDQLGEYVLRKALADAVRWPNLYIAVNLSPVQVRDHKFVDLVSAVLAECRIAPPRLVLEITETVLIDDPETAKSRLEALRRLGVRLALDDFGSGYSSLTYLQQLPFDKLKIDRAFVTALDHSANAGVIIQAVVALGRALGMSVTIEGIETEEQRVLLRLAGCNEMQGFLFSKAVPREEIDWLAAAEKSASAAIQVEKRAAS